MEPRWLLQALPGEYPDVVYFVPVDRPQLALTIDDGPDPEATPQILDLLAKYNAHATFFLLTDNIPGNGALVRRIVAAGHELGNHLTRDEVSSDLPPDEFSAKLTAATEVLEKFGAVRWFRPGSGWYNDHMLSEIRRAGLRLAEASMVPVDARIPSPRFVAAYINSSAKPGSVLVLHTNKGRGGRTLEILERVLPVMSQRGYTVTSMTQLEASVIPEVRNGTQKVIR